jgi:ubiquinone/menaquinone biosynthesis C-methylase UbiE
MRAADIPLGGVDDAGVEYVQCAAESIAAPDNSFDIVSAHSDQSWVSKLSRPPPPPPAAQVLGVYLLHELPEGARIQVAAEAYRVLKPGGLLVITDSVQVRQSQYKSKRVFADGRASVLPIM